MSVGVAGRREEYDSRSACQGVRDVSWLPSQPCSLSTCARRGKERASVDVAAYLSCLRCRWQCTKGSAIAWGGWWVLAAVVRWWDGGALVCSSLLKRHDNAGSQQTVGMRMMGWTQGALGTLTAL